MEDQEITDEMFARIATKAGGIKPLLDTFFSFLERKTDFYIQFDPADKSKINYKMGFPVGVSEKMVLQAFRQYKLKDYAEVFNDGAPVGLTSDPSPSSTPTKPKAFQKEADRAPSTPPRTTATPGPSTKPPSTPLTSVMKGSGFTPAYTPEGKQVPIGNGGIEHNYYWTQTLKDVTIYIDTAAGCRGKDVKCTIKAQSLYVEIRGEKILNGTLEDVIRVDESMWTISSTTDNALQQIVVTLDKTRPTWWKHVITGHEEIDTSKVDSTQNIGEYDETTQAAIRKIMFEQKQKLLGQAAVGAGAGEAEESDVDRILRGAAQLPGSPI